MHKILKNTENGALKGAEIREHRGPKIYAIFMKFGWAISLSLGFSRNPPGIHRGSTGDPPGTHRGFPEAWAAPWQHLRAVPPVGVS